MLARKQRGAKRTAEFKKREAEKEQQMLITAATVQIKAYACKQGSRQVRKEQQKIKKREAEKEQQTLITAATVQIKARAC